MPSPREACIGLVEVGGADPAGGGCLRMVERYTEPVQDVDGADLLPLIGKASLQIAMAQVATGAQEGRRLRYVRADDGITLDRHRLLYDAKQRALGLARSGSIARHCRAPSWLQVKTRRNDWAQVGVVTSGLPTGDGLIAKRRHHILCGGTVAAGTRLEEGDYLELEREAFLSLCGEEKSQARMQSIFNEQQTPT
ncbi:MAG: hypothetical protein R3C68_07435 [Myxococcota bacterium]